MAMGIFRHDPCFTVDLGSCSRTLSGDSTAYAFWSSISRGGLILRHIYPFAFFFFCSDMASYQRLFL